ncbi:MAG: hypothetical protein ACRERD_03170 [Candidatus Binatia bacterium]
MSSQLVFIDREALLTELQQAFDERTAEVLLNVLDKVATQVYAAGVTGEGFSELRRALAELAEAERRTEARMDKLAERMEELAQAQQRTDESLARLSVRMEELAQAQQRTEARVEELAQAQARSIERLDRVESTQEKLVIAVEQLRKQVGGLSETVGGDIEDIAYIVLHDVLKREFGWDVGVLERSWQTWDGEVAEVDVFGTATDPMRPDRTIWIVGEAKHNLTVKEVERFVRQVERARQHLAGEVFAVCFCYRARPEVQQMVREAGLRLVFSYGKLQ